MMLKHVLTNINPAGLVSIETTADVLTFNDLSLNGSLFLQKPMYE